MSGGPAAAGLHSLNSELLGLVIRELPPYSRDKHSLFCTCTAVRDAMLRAVGSSDGPMLRGKFPCYYEKLDSAQTCMQLWLKDGPRLKRAHATALKAAGRAQLLLDGCPGRPERVITQLMSGGGLWHHVTVVHLDYIVLENLVPDVLARNCPHLHTLHTLHLNSKSRLLGRGVSYRAHSQAKYKEDALCTKPNPDLDLQQCVSTSIQGPMRQCPQLKHLTLNVKSSWPDLEDQFKEDSSIVRQLRSQMEDKWQWLNVAPRAILQLRSTAQALQQAQGEQGALAEQGAQVAQEAQGAQSTQVLQGAQAAAVIQGRQHEHGRQLATSALQQQQDQRRQLKARASQLQATCKQMHEQQVAQLRVDIEDLQERQQEFEEVCEGEQPQGFLDHDAISDAITQLSELSAPTSDTSSDAITRMMQQAEQLLTATQFGAYHLLQNQIDQIEQQIKWKEDSHARDTEYMQQWWDLQQQLLLCQRNVKVAQHMHQQLGVQVQQQLAALPNLSSISIPEAKHLPPNTAHHVLQLGSQLTSLQLGSTSSMSAQLRLSAETPGVKGYEYVLRDTPKAIMPQQLASMCMQLTSLVCLQWDALVTDESMTTLLQLPSLRRVTIVTNLSKSFADAACSWQSLSTMHTREQRTDYSRTRLKARTPNSTCQHLAYLPLTSLRQPVQLLGSDPQDYNALLPHTVDAAADLQLVQQAVDNVARCGGVAWDTHGRCWRTGKTTFKSAALVLKSSSPPDKARLQVLEACLPLLGSPVAGLPKMMVGCDPLNLDVMGVLVPWLEAMKVHSLDLRDSVLSADLLPQLLALLPATIGHIILDYDPIEVSEPVQDQVAQFERISTGAVRSIKVQVVSRLSGYPYMFPRLMEEKSASGVFGPLVEVTLK